MTAELHTLLLSVATLTALLFAGLILARNPQSTSARLHAVYGALAAWWFFCMAMIASADSVDAVQFWARLVHLGIGSLVGVAYHLNVTTAGIAHRHRGRIVAHYAVAGCIVVFGIAFPNLLLAPQQYAWGPYPTYSLWGLVPVSALALVVIEVIWLYRPAIADANPDTAHFQKLMAFYRGNCLVALALVDFLPAFGVPVYPFGYLLLTLLNIATMFGSIRYRLIDVTPEFAAATVLTELPDGVLVIDSQGLVRYVNPAGAHMLGQSVADLMYAQFEQRAPAPLLPMTDAWLDEPDGHEVSFESVGDGRVYTVRISGAVLRDQAGARVGNVWLLHDLTEQRRVEAEKDELLGWAKHGQKLETLGVMAGGVAHDFNNLLTVILGNAELALARGVDDQGRRELQAILTATQRAADLAGQMLTYAGQGARGHTQIDLNSLTEEINALLHSALSRKAVLELDFMPGLPRVRGDRGQLCQVVMNLVTNASDALDGRVGTITVRTGILDRDAAQQLGASAPRDYVTLEVIDTGVGMDAGTLERMFDPFFTTKLAGRGLGLANVVAIVESHGGRIRVSSKPGEGTHVTVALPACDEADDIDALPAVRADHRGAGTVLLADDEDSVRAATAAMLQALGYDVIEARDGSEALRVFGERRHSLAAALLDRSMPGPGGREVLAGIRALAPEFPVVLMSGYGTADGGGDSHDPYTRLLAKPFRHAQLAECLEALLRTTA